MDRRQFLVTTGFAVIPFVSGCVTDPGTNGGIVEAVNVDEKPPNATITDAGDDRVRNVDPLQNGFQEATSVANSVAEIEMTESEYEVVAQALSDLPWYDGLSDDHHSSGIYFQYEGSVYVVVLTPFCTDSRFVDASSERGEHGWGDCYEKNDDV